MKIVKTSLGYVDYNYKELSVNGSTIFFRHGLIVAQSNDFVLIDKSNYKQYLDLIITKDHEL